MTYDFCYLRYFSFIRFSSFSAKKKWKPVSAYENYNLRQHLLGSRKVKIFYKYQGRCMKHSTY